MQDHQRIRRLKCDIYNDQFLYCSSFADILGEKPAIKKLLPQENMILCKDYLKGRKKFKTLRAAKAHYITFHATNEYDCERFGKIFKYRSSKY